MELKKYVQKDMKPILPFMLVIVLVGMQIAVSMISFILAYNVYRRTRYMFGAAQWLLVKQVFR